MNWKLKETKIIIKLNNYLPMLGSA